MTHEEAARTLRAARFPPHVRKQLMASFHDGHEHLRRTCAAAAAAGGGPSLAGGADAKEAAASTDAQSFLTTSVVTFMTTRMEKIAATMRDWADKLGGKAEEAAHATDAAMATAPSGKLKRFAAWIGKGATAVGHALVKSMVYLMSWGLDFLVWIMRNPALAAAVLQLVQVMLNGVCRELSIQFGYTRMRKDATARQNVAATVGDATAFLTEMGPSLLFEWAKNGGVAKVLGGMTGAVAGVAATFITGPLGGPLGGIVAGGVTSALTTITGSAFSGATRGLTDALMMFAFKKSVTNNVQSGMRILTTIFTGCIVERDVTISEMAARGDPVASTLQRYYAEAAASTGWFSRLAAQLTDPDRTLLPQEIAWARAEVRREGVAVELERAEAGSDAKRKQAAAAASRDATAAAEAQKRKMEAALQQQPTQ